MEDICRVCKTSAKVCCSCNYLLRFCYEDFFKVHLKVKGTHNPIAIETLTLQKKFIFTIEHLEKLKSEIISKSNQLIDIIQSITTKKISFIKKCIDSCETISKITDVDNEKMLKEYENIQIKETDINSFLKIVKKTFSIFNEENELIDSDVFVCEDRSNKHLSEPVCNEIYKEIKNDIYSSFE